jgi:hypothetical protein
VDDTVLTVRITGQPGAELLNLIDLGALRAYASMPEHTILQFQVRGTR